MDRWMALELGLTEGERLFSNTMDASVASPRSGVDNLGPRKQAGLWLSNYLSLSKCRLPDYLTCRAVQGYQPKVYVHALSRFSRAHSVLRTQDPIQ